MPSTFGSFGAQVVPPDFTDFRSRLPPAVGTADPQMVVQPYADPGYGMPNPFVGNLNQAPGQQVGGYLPTSGASPHTMSNLMIFAHLARLLPGMMQQLAQSQPRQSAPSMPSLPQFGGQQ